MVGSDILFIFGVVLHLVEPQTWQGSHDVGRLDRIVLEGDAVIEINDGDS